MTDRQRCDSCGARGKLFDLPCPLNNEQVYRLCPDCMFDVWIAVGKWVREGKE